MIILILVMVIAISFGLPAMVKVNSQRNSVSVIYLIFSATVLASFFLTWVNGDLLFGDLSLKGYEIPSKFKAIYNLRQESEQSNNGNIIVALLYILYLIPILSLSIFILAVYKRNREAIFAISTLSAITTLLGVASVVIKNNSGDEFISHLDIGFYSTVVAGFCLWISIFMTSESPTNTVAIENLQAYSQNPDTLFNNNDTLSQLLKLKTLREKDVITEEIYQKERQKLIGLLDADQLHTT